MAESMKRRSVWVVECWRERFNWEPFSEAHQNDALRWAEREVQELSKMYPSLRLRVRPYDARKVKRG
jgi:hypothetical protein